MPILVMHYLNRRCVIAVATPCSLTRRPAVSSVVALGRCWRAHGFSRMVGRLRRFAIVFDHLDPSLGCQHLDPVNLATIALDAPLPEAFRDGRRNAPDMVVLQPLFEHLRFGPMTRRRFTELGDDAA